MSSTNQCPSTVGKQTPQKPRVAHRDVGVSPTGEAFWRSLDDLSDTPEFRDWLEREFPAGASQLMEGSRRTFMKLMGASFALAGVAAVPGCRRPDHKIMAYSRDVPEETVPGKPIYFATSMPLPGGGAEGLLIETHEGRPTKAEGNPLHPNNRGKSSVLSQASVLSLYDPDRMKDPTFTESDDPDAPRSWKDFEYWSERHFESFDATSGDGLALIVEKAWSPTLETMRRRVLERFPKAEWVWYDPSEFDGATRGHEMAYGRAVHQMLHLDKADVVLSLDRDFLGFEPGSLTNAREFASRRRPMKSGDRMSRLYMVESSLTTTGGRADHRQRLAPSLIPSFAIAVAKALVEDHADALGAGAAALARSLASKGVRGSSEWAKEVDGGTVDLARAVASDLAAHKGHGLVVAGPTQPAAVHTLCAMLNDLLGNTGVTVSYRAMSEDEASSGPAGLASLARRMRAGEIETLVCAGVNPAYDAPGDLEFASLMESVPMRIALSEDPNETVALSHWRLPRAHYLEAWGDTRSADGTIAAIQPMIAPLYGAKSTIEMLSMIAGEPAAGYDLVRAAWSESTGERGFEKRWRRALHDGVLAGSAPAPLSVRVDADDASKGLGFFDPGVGPTDTRLDVVFQRTNLSEGRFANVGWLQELPDTTTRIVWDNVAMISPATAKIFDVKQGSETAKKRYARMVSVTTGDGRTVEIPAWETPGIPDNTVVLPMGYGRAVCGVVGRNVGVNVSGLRPSAEAGTALTRGATMDRVGGKHAISTTQSHGSMEGRALVRAVDYEAYRHWAFDDDGHDRRYEKHDHYGNTEALPFAEMLDGSAYSHTPANRNIYTNPQRGSKDQDVAAEGTDFAKTPQWGMTIDLSTCTGCNTCTVACQSENNIPIVGKAEVNKGREMQWIRVDRYFVGDDANNPTGVHYQPVACVHCENAPCETVCPVNATVHGDEGINYMVYNRCIGTRYCANNCPYKVRRFNFFDYATAKFNGDFLPTYDKDEHGEITRGFAAKEAVPGIEEKMNVNLVPPRLREQLEEISKMQNNPDVTVRSRGVMEKCTYCIQRINEARIETKLQDLERIPDGFFQTACQQACPSDSIVFGDILDETSRVSETRSNGRSYMLLGFLNTRPRTSYMTEVKNPNPALCSESRREAWHSDLGHHGHGGHDDHGGGHDGHGDDHHHDGDHGDGHGGGSHDGHGDASHADGHAQLPVEFIDRRQLFTDGGYKLSLSVLGNLS